MRIYLAAMLSAGIESDREQSILSEGDRLSYPWQLESYHYIQSNNRWPSYFRDHRKSIFLDSGAFTMFTKGVEVSLEQYADYLNTHRDWIHIASNIDEIGSDKEKESYQNQKQLERLIKDPHDFLCPVHHARDSDGWLQRYMAEGYDYIFLGGMVPETIPYLYGWLDHIWDKYLTNADGYPKIRVHGFGLTTIELIKRYPWYSVDSTSWIMKGRFGSIFMDIDERDTTINISEDSPTRHIQDRHFDNLSPPAQRRIIERIEELGFNPEELRTGYGQRDRFNIKYFERLGKRLDHTSFKKRQIGVFD